MRHNMLALQDPIMDIQEHVLFAGNGNVIACYRVELPEIHSLSETDFEDMHSTWFQALKSLSVGTVIHKQDIYRKERFSSGDLPNNSFLEQATHRYFKGRPYIAHESYLFFATTQNKAFNHPKYVNPFKKVAAELPKLMDAHIRRFLKEVNDAVSFLNNSRKVALISLNPQEITELTHAYFNGFQKDMTTDILLDKKQVQIANSHFDVLAVNSELCFGGQVQHCKPNKRFTSDDFVFHQGFIDGIGLALDENHVVNQIIYLDDSHKWRRHLDKRIEELKKSIHFGSWNKATLEKVQAIRDKIDADDTARIIRGHLNVIYWAKDERQRPEITSKITAEFKELDMVPHYPKSEERKNYFLNSYFGFSANFSNEDLYVTDLKHALCLLINSTNYKSDLKGILFNDREYNVPIYKDVWDEEKRRIKARNFTIFAPTGEGKSFLANTILRQYFESGVRLVIIDLGGSYAKFAKLYPEQHALLRYESGKNLGINPFYIQDASDITPERLEDLSEFLFELLATSIKASKPQAVALKKILRHYYQEVATGHSLEGFYDFIAINQHQLLERLAIHPEYFNCTHFLHILSEYVHNGLYSFLFETQADQTFRLEDKRLIVFELDDVKENKEILSVMLKLIKSAIQRTIWKNRSERGIILFDEFAKQLKFDSVLESVEFYYQAIRKQNGAIGIILQSINQLPKNSTSASILENSQIIYSLNNEKGYKELAKRLNLSKHDLNQLKSIKNNFSGTRKYTEVFIKIGKESNIYRLEVPPEAYAAYLTDGIENEAIMKLFQEHQNMEKAIQAFVAQLKKQNGSPLIHHSHEN